MERLTGNQLEMLREFDTPTICNAIEAFNIRSRIAGFGRIGMRQRMAYEKPMIGYASTAKVSAMYPPTPEQAEMTMGYYQSVLDIDGPSIAVIQDIDPMPIGSFWGEVQATTHKAMGSVGTLTQGGVRDIPPVEELGYYFMSTEILVSHGYIHIEDYACPVEICGLIIHPGDLIHADIHGFTVIPHSIAPRLYDACVDISNAELPMLEPCRRAIERAVRPTADELRTWRKAMADARTSAER